MNTYEIDGVEVGHNLKSFLFSSNKTIFYPIPCDDFINYDFHSHEFRCALDMKFTQYGWEFHKRSAVHNIDEKWNKPFDLKSDFRDDNFFDALVYDWGGYTLGVFKTSLKNKPVERLFFLDATEWNTGYSIRIHPALMWNMYTDIETNTIHISIEINGVAYKYAKIIFPKNAHHFQ